MTDAPPRPPAPIKTPCIKVCVVDGESGLCLGCYRKLSEVAGWARLSDAELLEFLLLPGDGARETIMTERPDRKGLLRPEKLAMF